jgi:hypothetical protein
LWNVDKLSMRPVISGNASSTLTKFCRHQRQATSEASIESSKRVISTSTKWQLTHGHFFPIKQQIFEANNDTRKICLHIKFIPIWPEMWKWLVQDPPVIVLDGDRH